MRWGGEALFPDMLEVVAQARALDHIAVNHDAQLAMRLQARRGSWPLELGPAAACRGMASSTGRRRAGWCCPAAPKARRRCRSCAWTPRWPWPTILAQVWVDQMSLIFDVPQTPRQDQPFNAWCAAGQALAISLDAEVTDDSGQRLHAESFAMIREDSTACTTSSRSSACLPVRRSRAACSAEVQPRFSCGRAAPTLARMSQTDLFSDLSSDPPSEAPTALRAAELRRQLHHHAHLYYVLDAPGDSGRRVRPPVRRAAGAGGRRIPRCARPTRRRSAYRRGARGLPPVRHAVPMLSIKTETDTDSAQAPSPSMRGCGVGIEPDRVRPAGALRSRAEVRRPGDQPALRGRRAGAGRYPR